MKQYKIAAIEFARIRAYTLIAIFNPCGFTLFRVEKFNERRQRAYRRKCETKQKKNPKTRFLPEGFSVERERKKYTRKKFPNHLSAGWSCIYRCICSVWTSCRSNQQCQRERAREEKRGKPKRRRQKMVKGKMNTTQKDVVVLHKQNIIHGHNNDM